MKKIHTHYDNLKVAQSANQETIKKAYRRLCRQYHPDCNPNHPQAERIMSLINQSYAVLSNPKQREEHDQWIAEQTERLKQEKLSSPMPEHLKQRKESLPWINILIWIVLLSALLAFSTYWTSERLFH